MTATNTSTEAAPYAGVDRRNGFDRRAVAPREAKDGPKIVSAIAVAGYPRPFVAGQEKAFMEAVKKANDTAKREQREPEISLEALEARGAIRGFIRKGKDAPEVRTTISRQTDRQGKVVAPENDNAAPVPGGADEATFAPRPRPEPESAKDTAARTGGAGRTGGGGGKPAAGEKAAGEKAANTAKDK